MFEARTEPAPAARQFPTKFNTIHYDWIPPPPPPILEHFCHISYKSPRWVSFCADGISFCPEHHLQPLFFTQLSHTPFRDMYVPKTPQRAQVHPKTPPFLTWTWKWAKWTTFWAICTPTGQNVWKVGKTFLEVGKKIYSSMHWTTDQFLILTPWDFKRGLAPLLTLEILGALSLRP